METANVFECAKEMHLLVDHATGVFPAVGYFEGWREPSDIDWDRVLSNKWSDSNPAMPMWRELEKNIARIVDLQAALLIAEGVDLNDMGLGGALDFVEGSLSRFIGKMFRNGAAKKSISEALKSHMMEEE